jgi:hypothetical protein
MLEHLMFGPHGLNETGCVIEWAGEYRLLLVDRIEFIADEAAQKQALDLFGAAGLRSCIKCANLVSCASELADINPFFKDFRCANLSAFVRNTDADLHRMHSELEALGGGVSAACLYV